MPSDVLITPASSKVEFTDGSNATKTLRITGTSFSFDSDLGIGITSPTSKLNVLSTTSLSSVFKAEGVNGTLFEVTDDLSNSLMSVNTIGGLPVFEVFANNTIIAGQYGANDFVINGNKVGIGIATPTTKLEVVGAIRGGLFSAGTTNSGEAWFGRASDRALGSYTLQFGGASASGTFFELIDRAWSKVIFAVSGEAPTNTFKITSVGNLGIGDGSPNNKLHVAGSASIGSSYNTTGPTNGLIVQGNVGIGTTNPISPLEIYKVPATSTTLQTMLTINTDFASASGTGFGGSITFKGRTAGNELQDNAQISAYNENTGDNGYALGFYTRPTVAGGLIQRMTILRGGNVGIGIINPTAILNVKTSTQPNREVFMGDSAAVSGVFRARLDDNSLSFISLENRDLAATTDHGVGIRFNLATSVSNNAINAGGIYLGKEQQWTATASTQDSYLAFATSLDGTANEKVRIKSDGNVGIGTNSPTQVLDVRGNIKLGADNEGNYIYYVRDNEGTIIRTARSDVTQVGLFRSDGWGNFTVDKSIGIGYSLGTGFASSTIGNGNLYVAGNVGIGTTNPSRKLHIKGTTQAITLEASYSGASGIIIGSQYTGTTECKGQIWFLNPDSGYGGALAFATQPNSSGTSAAERMRIGSDGNVGIGTSSPAGKFDVRPDSSWIQAEAFIVDTDGGNNPRIRLYRPDGVSATTAYPIHIRNDSGNLNILTGAAAALGSETVTSKFYFTAAGNLGIGTTTPSSKLHISNAAAATRITITDDVANGRSGYIESNYSDALVIGTTSGVRSIRFAPDNSIAMTIAVSTNNVGIGALSPNNKLAVSGSVSIGSNYNTAAPTNGLIVEGSVGIGVTSPDANAKLHVYGNDAHKYIFYTDTAGSSSTIFQRNNTVESVVLTLANTRGPSVGTDRGTSLNLDLGYGGSSASAGTLARGAKISAFSSTSYTSTASTQNAYLAFYTALAGSLTEKMRIDSNGNVGIGTVSPSTTLHVNSTTSGATLLRADGTNGTLFSVVDDLSDSLMSVNNSAGLPVLEVFADDRVVMGQYGQNDFVLVNNKLGLGTNNPAYKLDINGTLNVSGTASLSTVSITGTINSSATEAIRINNNNGFISFYNSAASTRTGYLQGNTGSSVLLASENNAIIQFAIGGTIRATINANGNLGIGTTTPSAKLTIVDNVNGGTINLVGRTSDDTAAVNFRATGDSSTYAYISPDTNEFRLYHNDGFMSFYPGGTEKWRITSAGVFESNNAQTIRTSTGNLTLATNAGNGHIILSPHSNGNVGIGTASPVSKLEIYSTTGNSQIFNQIQLTNLGTPNTGDIVGIGFAAGETIQYGVKGSIGYVRTATFGRGAITFYTNNTAGTESVSTANERMRIAADGNVGIGTTAPAYKLDVNGILGISGTFFADKSTNYFRILEPAGNVALYLGNASDPTNYSDNTNHAFRNRGGSSVYAYINSNGNLGIGTTSPAQKLDVRGYIVSDVNSNGAESGFYLGSSAHGLRRAVSTNDVYLYTTSGTLYLGTTGNSSQQITLLNNGNVGIGTTSPLLKLDVRGVLQVAGGADGIYISNVGDNSAYDNVKLYYTGYNSGSPRIYLTPRTQPGSGNLNTYLYLQSNVAGGPGSNTMGLLVDGNVGIGATSPAAKLDVVSSPTAIGTIIRVRDTVTLGTESFAGIHFTSSPGTDYTIGKLTTAAGAGLLQIRDQSGNQFVTINSSGNVGIGITNPAYKLDVNGATRFGGIVYNEAVQTDNFNYFNLQPYIESETLSTILSFGGAAPTFLTLTNTTAPFSKVMSVSAYGEAALGDYIPVQAGETIYGEIWAYRATGAVGTAGVLYCGVMRYDKDKKMIDSNAGLNTAPSGYFIAFNQTIPSNSTWTKYSGTLVLPTSHTPYNTSDGGPVRYIRPYIIYNYTAGTILTYIGGWKIRKVELTRDAGPVAVNGSVAIGSNSVNYGRLQISAVTTTPNLSTTNPTDVSLIISNSDVAYGTMFATYGDGKGALQQRRTNAATYYDFILQPHGGNVGIATTSPSQKLEVQGNVKLNSVFGEGSTTGVTAFTHTTDSTQPSIYLWGKDHATYPGQVHIIGRSDNASANAGKIGFYDYNGTGWDLNMVINKNGNVGIGINDPSTKLDVAGEIRMPVIKQSTTLYAGTDITDDDSTRTVYFNIPAGGYSPPKYFKVARIKITANYQNVSLNGYFTVTNSTGLHVGSERKVEFDFIAYAATNPGAPTVTYLKRGPDTTTVLVYAVPNGGGAGTTYYDVYIRSAWYNDTNGELAVRVGYSSAVTIWQTGLDSGTSAPTDTLINPNSNYSFDTTGYVGIGTTSPSGILHLYGSNQRMFITSTSDASQILFGQWDGSTNRIESSNRKLFLTSYSGGISFGINGSDDIFLTTNRNLGIGFTSAVNNKLAVNGSASIGSNYNTAAPANGLIVEGSVGIGITSPSGLLNIFVNAARNLEYSSTGLLKLQRNNLTFDGAVPVLQLINTFGMDAGTGLGTGIQIDLGYGGSTTVAGTAARGARISAINDSLYTSTASTQNASLTLYTSIAGSLTEKMRVTSVGNVGIGVTAPTSKLNILSSTSLSSVLKAEGINGTLFEVTDDLSNSLMSVNTIGGLPVFEVFANNIIIAGQYGANDLVITGNKIGVGTANPSFKLDVTGSFGLNAGANDGNWPFLVVDTSSSGGTNRYALNKIGAMGFNNADNYAQLQLVGSSGAYIDFANAAVDDFDARIIYYSNSRFDIQYGTVMTINSTGVGIGTTSPGYLFAVNNGSDVWHAQFGQVGGNQFRIGGNTTNGAVIGAYADNTNNNPRQLLLNRDGGNVGIGISNALYRLHVNGTGYFNSTLQVNSNITLSGGGDVIINDSDGTGFFASFMDSGVGYIRIDDGGTANGTLNINSGTLFVGPSSGNVGIGTVTPGYKLDVSGIARVGDAFYITTATTADCKIEIGNGRSGNGNSYIDLVGDATYTDYGLRLIRSNGGPNTTSAIAHRGTGTLYITAVEAASIALETSNTTRVTINSSGNVGIGTTSPVAKLDTLGVRLGRDFSLANRATVRLDANGAAFPSDILFGHTTTANQDSWNGVYWSLSSRGTANSNRFYFYRGTGNPAPNNSEAVIMSFDPTLNVGIGFEAPTNRLSIAGSVSIGSGYNTAGPTNGLIVEGSVGIGITAPLQKFQVDGAVGNPATSGTTQNGIARLSNATDNAVLDFGIRAGGNGAWIQSTDETSLAANYPLLLNPNGGSVGIGMISPTTSLDVAGTMRSQYIEGLNEYTFRGANRAINDWEYSGLTINPTYNSYDDGSWYIDAGNSNSWDRGILSIRRFRRVEGLTLEYESFAQDNDTGGIYTMIGFVGGNSTSFNYQQTPANLTYQSNVNLTTYTNGVGSGTDYDIDTRNAWYRFKTVLKGTGALHYVYRSGKWNLIKETSSNNQNDYEYLRVLVSLYRQRIHFRDMKVYVAQQSYRGTNYIDVLAGRLIANGSVATGVGGKLTFIGLDINSGATPTYIKIITTIPSNSPSADFTVNIKGFSYGSQSAVDISICWHWYTNTFYNATAKSSGGWAPTIRLSAENGFVAIVLTSGVYWQKLYVESMYSSNYNNQYSTGWSWVDADATGNPIVTLAYRSHFGNNFIMYGDGTVTVKGSDNNSGKSDFSVDSGGTATMALSGQYFRVGDTDVNWAMKMQANGYLAAYGQQFDIATVAGAHAITFATNNIERMRIAGVGSVGVGTTNPTARLDVAGGGLSVSGWSNNNSGSAGGVEIGFDGSQGIFQVYDRVNNVYRPSFWNASYLMFYLSGVEKARLNSSGNFGIGFTSTINNKLAVQGSASIGSNYNIAAPTDGLIVEGSVGIGVTSPSSKLHIVTTGTNDGIILDGTSNPIFVHRTSGSDRTYLATTTNAGAFFTDAGQYDFIIRSQTNNILLGRGSGASTMAIVGNNVGIGTVVPAARLHVNSTTSGATLLRADGTNGTLFSVVDDLSDSLMSVNNSAGLPVLEVFADDRIVAGQYGANDFVLVNNKLGLGTNNPNAKLESYYSSNAITFNYLATNLNVNSPIPVYGFDVTSGAESRSIKAGIGYERHLPNGRGTLHFYNDSTNDTQSLAGNRTTAGDIKMSLDNSGNLGIGTPTPSWLLTVYAASAPQFALSNATRSFILTNNAGDGLLSFNYASVNRLQFNTTNQWFNTGNLGIGTSSPAALLQVGTGTPTASTSGIQFGDDTSARIYRDSSTIIKVTGGFQSVTYIQAGNYLQTVGNLIYPAGFSSTQRLEVGNAAQNAWITGISIAPGGNVVIAGYLNAGGQTLNGQSFYQWEGATYRNPADHTPQFLLREDNSSTGINGFAPALALYNNNGGNQTTVGMVFVSAEAVSPTQGNAVNLAGIIAKKESAGTAGAWSRGSLNFFVKDFGTKVDALTIQYTGNVGIGTSNPATLLQVGTGSPTAATGGIQFGDDTGARIYRVSSSTIQVSNNLTVGGTLTESSSIRYKENIKTISAPILPKLEAIRPVTYNKKDNANNTEYGIIAEELNELFPELVNKNDNGEVESVNYSRLTVLLIKAVKELKQEIEILKNK